MAIKKIFAPVVVVERFTDFAETVNMANNSKYGLQAGGFTRDLANMNYAAEISNTAV